MATLKINGQNVTVDDSFLKLPPDQQNATVDEIAQKLGAQGSPAPAAPSAPGTMPDGQPAPWEDQLPIDQALRQKTVQEQGANIPSGDLGTATGVTINNAVNGIPVLGPLLQNATDNVGGLIAQATGGDYRKYRAQKEAYREAANQKYPISAIGGNIEGALASFGGLAKLPGMAVSLGLEGGLVPQIINSGGSQLAIGTADSMARGDKPTDALAGNVAPAAIASAIPLLGAGGKYAGKLLNDNILKPISTAFNRENEVTKRIGTALQQDKNLGAAMSPADEAVAANANVPVMNADRFGPSVRGLARTAANISPEAKGQFVRTIEDRFTHQSGRAIDFVKGLMNGAVDDLGLHEQLRSAADKANGLAYGKAYADLNARAVWTPEIKQLMQSDQFRAAINAAETRGTDKAAISGVKAVRNPFVFGQDGSVTLKTNPDGSRALPSLQFWNQVKINLDSAIGAAKPTATNAGDRALYSDLTAMKQRLVGSLDQAVPSYKAARGGAASFFGADDAVDAGRKALGTRYEIPELERGYAKLKPAERSAAAVGYASELIDRFKGSGDHRNFIGQFFDSPEARRKNELFLGPDRSRQLEAYVRVEGIVDQLRGAVTGNSTTAQQLIAAGVLGGAGGYFGSGGNIQTGFTAATLATLGRRGLQVLGKRVDDQVMNRVAEILVSKNPKDLQRAIQNAALSKAHMDALAAIYRGMTLSARSTISAGASAMAGAQ